jgi:hypothetical protein
MKEHLLGLHKALAAHHDRVSKLHKTHADALDDADPHAAFHRGMGEEHADMARYHKACAKAVSEDDTLPDVEGFDPSGRSKALVPADPRMRRAAADDGLERVAGALPDNEDAKRRLAEKGLRTVPRFGQPTIEDSLEESAAAIEPELRKALV